jgi:curved DNA binding protein
VTKYRLASDIANEALRVVVEAVKPGASVLDACNKGDAVILEKVKGIFNKGKIEKGIAFPTCCSINNVAGHFSPAITDTTTFKEGDLVKIDLGAHIDGFASQAATTVFLGAEGAEVTGRAADVMSAVYYAAEACIRLLRTGNKSTELTHAMEKIADSFNCKPVFGVSSHQLKQFLLDDTEHVILSKHEPESKIQPFEFKANEAYTIDVCMSTGSGKTVQREDNTTVYRRVVENNYRLKLKWARSLLHEVNSKFPTFPFTMRALDSNQHKLGLTECVSHGLLQPYPVYWEAEGEFVAQIKLTALIMPTGTVRITPSDSQYIDISKIKSEHSIQDEELVELLAKPLPSKKRRKKKKAKKAAADE